jgi:hypothetical protein
MPSFLFDFRSRGGVCSDVVDALGNRLTRAMHRAVELQRGPGGQLAVEVRDAGQQRGMLV